jgi:hypothetical protein
MTDEGQRDRRTCAVRGDDGADDGLAARLKGNPTMAWQVRVQKHDEKNGRERFVLILSDVETMTRTASLTGALDAGTPTSEEEIRAQLRERGGEDDAVNRAFEDARTDYLQRSRPGDRIVFARADDRFDVLGVDHGGGRQVRREALATLKDAYEIARSGLEQGGRLWYSHHSDPDSIAPYRLT